MIFKKKINLLKTISNICLFLSLINCLLKIEYNICFFLSLNFFLYQKFKPSMKISPLIFLIFLFSVIDLLWIFYVLANYSKILQSYRILRIETFFAFTILISIVLLAVKILVFVLVRNLPGQVSLLNSYESQFLLRGNFSRFKTLKAEDQEKV